MRSSTFAASRMQWPGRHAAAASTASCAVIFITQRSSGSRESFTSTTATGLKAAPPLSKMPAEHWRFSAGQHSATVRSLAPSQSPFARSQRSPPRYPAVTVQSVVRPLDPAANAAHPLRLLVVTDAWAPQVNGVVRTLEILGRDLAAMGHEVDYATPEGRFTMALPTYPEIRLAIFPRRSLERMIDHFQPTAIHIATEGPLGWSARAICLKRKIPFTTSFHTRFPEYVNARFPFISESLVYRGLRRFHGPATAMMVATQTLKHELESHGFTNTRIWSRGVDVDVFRPIPGATLPFERPIWLY